MKKYIYDNSNGLWYELHGDYYLPCLVIPEEEVHTIGIWGRKHQQYLREHSENIILFSTTICFSAASCMAISLTLTLRLEISSTCL